MAANLQEAIVQRGPSWANPSSVVDKPTQGFQDHYPHTSNWEVTGEGAEQSSVIKQGKYKNPMLQQGRRNGLNGIQVEECRAAFMIQYFHYRYKIWNNLITKT